MARADYCGDGRGHTANETSIDMYDRSGVQIPTPPSRASTGSRPMVFEAAWGPDGAYCLARTRYLEPVNAIMEQCPGRFVSGIHKDLGDGDVCTVQRASREHDATAGWLLRNRTY